MTSTATTTDAGTAIAATKVSGPGFALAGTKNTDKGWAAVRAERASRLSSCDWTQMPDSPLTTALKASWATYRQALRDITKTAHIKDLVWPTAPGASNG